MGGKRRDRVTVNGQSHGGSSRYSLDDIDTAIAESIGPRAWEAHQGAGFCRPALLDRAAAARFWDQRPEDLNSGCLRAARADLEHDGCLRPIGGWGDEQEGKEPWE